MSNSNFYIFAFATFGHPNDFRQTPFKYKNPEIAKKIKVFDLSNAIKVFPNSTIYSIRKDQINSSKLISYSIYTFAQEQTSRRDGTFIGSSIILENNLAEEKYIISCLNEFHQKLTENNLENGILKVNHSKDFIPISNLNDFDKIQHSKLEFPTINFLVNNRALVVYCETTPQNLETTFNKSIDLLNKYDIIYFTNSEEVAKFVVQKGLYVLIQNVDNKRELDNEINKLNEEKKLLRDNSILEYERELQKITDAKNISINDYKSIIAENENRHRENENSIKDSINEINKLSQFYDDFLNKSHNLLNEIKHKNANLDEIKLIHNKNKILFNDSIGEFKRPNYITKINKPTPKGSLQTEQLQREIKDHKSKEALATNVKATYKLNIYKLSTVSLSILLLSTWGFILFTGSNEDQEHEHETYQSNTSESVEKEQIKKSNNEEDLALNPIPNNELNRNDYTNVAKNLSYNLKIKDVVKIIFEKNPTEIKSKYSGQELLYSNKLLELNKNCFEGKNGETYFIKDTIKHIPSYKN